MPNPEYIQRIDRVIDYLRENFDRQVKLEELTNVACFSEYHFHRIFGAVSGETLNNFTNRLRVEKAARLLRFSDKSLTDIALDCGFSSSATFSRAFRNSYDTSPSQYRKTGEIKNSKICKELGTGQEYVLPMSTEEKIAAFPVTFVDFPERQVAYIRVTNAFEMNGVIAAFKTITDWAKSEDIFSRATLFGMTMDDPDVTRDYFIREWLISSDFEPEHAPALEIFLDREKATDWSHFDLDLCLPIKNLQKTGG